MRRKALSLLLLLPFALASAFAPSASDALGTYVGGQLARVVPKPKRPEPPSIELQPDVQLPPVQPAVERAALATERTSPATGRKRGAARRAQPTAVRLTSAHVLELARRRMVPRASFVRPSSSEPGGLALPDIERLGIGLRNGAVLTHVAGQPVTSVPQVVELVLAARSRNAPEVWCQVWQAGQVLDVAVEQPYEIATNRVIRAPSLDSR